MRSFNKARSVLTRAAAATFAGLAVTIAVNASPANAATGIQAYGLHISRVAPCQYQVQMSAHVPMNLHDANGYLNNGARMEFRVFGQDRWFDNLQFGPVAQAQVQTWAELNGVHSSVLITLGCSTLDEDWKDRDEIFFKARFVDGDGVAIEAQSSVVQGDFHL